MIEGVESGLVVRPGDALVLRVSAFTSRAAFEQFAERIKAFKEEHGIDVPVLVVGCEDMAVVMQECSL